jgi:hypothetical protein
VTRYCKRHRVFNDTSKQDWECYLCHNEHLLGLKRGKPPQRKTRVKARNAKRKGHRFPGNVDEAYREWIRSLPCQLARPSCFGPVQPAHVQTRGAGGLDRGNIVPLCAMHHQRQHLLGIKSFQRVYGLDLAAIARNLGERYTPTEAAW